MTLDFINAVFKEQDEITSGLIDEIYDGSFKILRAYVFSMCMDATLTDDVVFQVLTKSVDRMKKFRHDEPVFKWLCRMAYEELHSKKYENRFVPPEDNPNLKKYIYIGSRAEMSDESAAKLSYALKSLNSVYRDIFYLKVLGGLSDRIVAEFYGRPQNFVHSTYLKAKAQIMSVIQEG